MKDYYQILGLPPSATTAEIKIAYRKLAHRYHPDKNPSDVYAAAHFSLIKEAYLTLTRPGLKEQYLRERWLYQSMGKKAVAPDNTPPQLLQAVLATHRQLHLYDEHRVDKKGVHQSLLELITPEKTDLLNRFNQEDINQEIVKWIMDCLFLLYPKDQLLLLDVLEKIHAPEQTRLAIGKKRREIHNTIRFNRIKPFLILLLIILLCVIIAYSL
ncbi:J domain-containing protein [Niabella beijingensis]|uniref:J domain-containing protein n=1 Tax=Niabella beijingensis TaxID=2872700 RepID=UPI0021D4104E|nr:J domain-containing protein [Niabella beijingensis]